MPRTSTVERLLMGAALLLVVGTAVAKLPAPSDDAKAKAAEAAAKAAHGNKVANYQLCKSMDAVAAAYQAKAKKEGKDIKPATPTEPCADPGAFVYPPPAVAAPAGAAPAAVAAAPAAVAPAPAPAVVAPKK